MTRQERRKRRRQRRRRMQAGILLLLALVLGLIIALRAGKERETLEQEIPLAVERQTLAYIAQAPALPDTAAEETPGGARGAAGRAGAREQIRGTPFQRRGRLYPRLPRLPRGARRELRGTSRRRRGRSKPYALRLFPGYGRGGRISEIRRRMAILPRSVPLLGGAGQGAISRGAYRHRGAGAHSFRGYGLFFDRAL